MQNDQQFWGLFPFACPLVRCVLVQFVPASSQQQLCEPFEDRGGQGDGAGLSPRQRVSLCLRQQHRDSFEDLSRQVPLVEEVIHHVHHSVAPLAVVHEQGEDLGVMELGPVDFPFFHLIMANLRSSSVNGLRGVTLHSRVGAVRVS